MSVSAGTRLGRYEIIAPIGAGGMGEVYVAKDTRLDRKVAIKVLQLGRIERGLARERFEAEAKAISSLNHPHICSLYDVGDQDGRDYLVMELVEGETIARRLSRGGLPPEQVLRYAIEIAEALDHAHRRNIVHRDLKPANVMVTSGGVKLLDFGLAKWQPAPLDALHSLPTISHDHPLTGEGNIVGTLQYMAPEQVDGGAIDARTDLFAFGALVHEMATGKKAFDAASPSTLAAAIRSEMPPPISTLKPLSPSALDRVITKCLAKEPGERWQSARDLSDALKWIGQDSSQAASSRSHRVPPVAAKTTGRVAMVGAATLFAVAAVVAGLWFWRRPPMQATNLRLVSSVSGEHWGGSFSPDGRFIAFLKDAADGIPQVWVKNLAEGEPLQITFGEIPARRLAWSPLNDRIVFSRFRAGLWSVPPLGGAARRLLEFGDAPKLSADGKRMVFTRGSTIWIANADGTDAHEVSGVPKSAWTVDRAPDLSPDGQTIAFFQPGNAPVRGDVWVIPAAGGNARQITFDASETASLTWTPDGRSIIYASARGGSLTLWRVAATGGIPTALTTGAGEDTEPDVSSDGKTLLYASQRKSWSLVTIDAATGQEREVISRRARIAFPAFSPAGDRIAFVQPGVNSANLFVASADGRDIRRVTHGEQEQNLAPQWSGDAKFLYFYQLQPSTSFRRISVEGGTSEEVAKWDFLKERSAHVERTGRAVVYEVGENNPIGPSRATRVRDLASAKEHLLARPLTGPRWSPDSRTVYGWFISPDPGGDPWNRWNVAACPADGQPCRTLVRGFGAIPTEDGSRFFYIRDTGAARQMREVWSANVDGTNAHKVTDIGPLPTDGWEWDVSPTNQIAYIRLNASRRELWAADLK